MKVTFLHRKSFVVAALTAAKASVDLLRQQTPLLYLFSNGYGEGGHAFLNDAHSSPILFAAAWRHGQEQQQHILAASLAETEVAASVAGGAPLFNEADCTYPSDDVAFEKVISTELLRLLLERSPQIAYRGVSTSGEIARAMHKDISCAIQTSSLFHDFCNTNEKSTEDDNKFLNLSECLAFLAHAAVHTRSWTIFSDSSRGRECTVSEKYPCGPATASYHARGPFMLRGNEEYGAFGEAVLQDSARLLNEPEVIQPQGIGGWAAALWKWMSERPYGLNCPETLARSGRTSCHAAMLHQDSPPEAAANALRDNDEAALKDAVAGFGQTIHINGGTSLECCPSALDTFQREGGLLQQNVFTSSSSLGVPGASVTAEGSAGANAAGINAGQQPERHANQLLRPSQEQLFQTIMSGGDSTASPPAASAGSATVSEAPQIAAASQASMQPSNRISPISSGSPTSPIIQPNTSAVASVARSSPAAVGAGASPQSPAPPVTAALLLSTFLSFLSVALPDVPPSTDEHASAVLHPFSSARVPSPVPLPGSVDGLCSTQGALTLQAAAENADDKERGKAAALESRFCLSLIRGCPSLLSKSAAQVSSKSTDEEAAKAVQEATSKHPQNSSVVFKCFETSPAGLAAAAADAASSSGVEVLPDDEEKMKEKLNTMIKYAPVGSFSYISRNGITCAFFNTKSQGLQSASSA